MTAKTSASAPYCRLLPGFVAAILLLVAACQAAAEAIKVGGSGAGLSIIRLLADGFAKEAPDFRATIVPNLGSSGGVKALAAGAIDLAVTSRPMRENERALGLSQLELGRTPFLFAVSASSKVATVTTRQLADIYAGKLTSWPDGSPIRIVLRPASDVDSEIVKGISPELGQALSLAERRPGVAFSVTDQDAANDIERISGAIGPSSLVLLIGEKRPLRALKLDGIEPTLANIASGAYPHYKRLFFLAGAKHSATVQRFIAFGRSSAGRKLLAQSGIEARESRDAQN